MAAIKAGYYKAGDRRGTWGLSGTKNNSKRQDFKGQPILWSWKPTGAVSGIKGWNVMMASPFCWKGQTVVTIHKWNLEISCPLNQPPWDGAL